MTLLSSSSLALALGALAVLSTTVTLAMQAALSLDIGHGSLGQATSIVSAILEAVFLVEAVYLCASIFVSWILVPAKSKQAIAFGLGVLISTIATATSTVGLAYSRTAAVRPTSRGFVTASVVVLVVCLLSQISFLIVYFVSTRAEMPSTTWAFNKDEERSLPSRSTRVKAIRYSQTFPTFTQSQRSTMWLEQPLASPRSLSCRSTVETARGSLSSMSQLTRPTSSVCRLLPPSNVERGFSMESSANRSSGVEAFDTWDTSAVDAHNRQAVLEISSPTQAKGRCLETIPASPTPSRSPSPASMIGLEPPQVRSSRRSFSPVSIDRERLPRPTTPGANSEAHIHPLFRSDSPDPPPLASPGTSVMAAPDAGRVIMHRASNRSLNRMRSGSLPMTRSPLSRQGSFEDGRSLRLQHQSDSDTVTVDEPEARPQTGRTMTSPAGEWFLGGGISR